MLKGLESTVTLHNGVEMPRLGLGVYKMEDGDEVKEAVLYALKNGYRSIDTASLYGNEIGVGEAVKESGIPRESIFVTSKVWNTEQGYEETIKSFEASLKRLDMEYLDLFLIHWPAPELGKFKETWRALEKLYNDSKIKAIGVSNFKEEHLEALMEDASIVPMVNQIELHPSLTQEPLRAFCEKHDIKVEAWSPLKQGKLFENPVLKAISEKHGKSVAQIIIRWDLQHGIITIPKSVTPHRIDENSHVFDFELTDEEMKQIDQLNQDERVGPDPLKLN